MSGSTSEQSQEEKVREDLKYGEFSRFQLELEFVQCLGNVFYVSHLASQKMFDKPEFIAYLDYLQYWKQPEYARYLTYPGPALKALELLQQENFRESILVPDITHRFAHEFIEGSRQDT